MDRNVKRKSKDIKKETVATLSDKVGKAKTIAFAKYHGLSVNQIGDLRQKIKSTGGEMLVAKNTLVKRALLLNNFEVPEAELVGPLATILAYDDEIAPIKTVADANKILGLPEFVFGFFGRNRLDVSSLDKLAKIPGRDVLQAQVVGALVGPIRGIVTVLNANLRNLAVVIDQIAKQKS